MICGSAIFDCIESGCIVACWLEGLFEDEVADDDDKEDLDCGTWRYLRRLLTLNENKTKI
jgi:hypothetical protein